ncbi:flagellar protein FlaG [Mobilitalea sibirica]|uniref:Flagellar protein FlaG n=1 Tax=Mobilitalea sibirica TaxID=1462919 RepID=A0A8J7HC66_9FIRM|nr:flagellar protein FlaG [Mobilitalea sibirica]MBH1942466.1 flagellar protein FlaG [Mobilitalea sibirica]
MALDALSGSSYHDVSKSIQKPEPRVQEVSEQGVKSISITETANSYKAVGTQTTKGQESEQKQNSNTGNQVKNAVNKANTKMKQHRTGIEFQYHEDINRVSIKIFDKETDEVIREIPPEEALEMVEKMWELAGLLVDEKR